MITADSILEDLGKTMDEVMDDMSEARYFAYRHEGQTIHVESTATNIMESLTGLPVYLQAQIFAIVAKKIPNPGDSDVFQRDSVKAKNRGARVTRLTSTEENVINLLLSR